MPREIYSDDSLRSRNSLDSQQYLRRTITSKDTKRRTTKDLQRESQNLAKRKHHKTQIDYPIDQQDSDNYLNWNTTNYDWTTRTLLKKLQQIPRCHDQGTQQNSRGFAGIHKGMNPYSEDEIARTELPDQSESKSQGCMGCFRRKRVQSVDIKRQKRQCFGLSCRKKKRLNREEREIMENTNMNDTFVPLQKSTGTSASTTVKPLDNKVLNTQDKAHKRHKKLEKSTPRRKKDIFESETLKAPATMTRLSTIKLETEEIPVTRSLINDETYRSAVMSDFTKSCCYLCVENTARIATASNNVKRRHKAVEALPIDNGGAIKKHDKTCNPTPCVRSVHSSVKMSMFDESTSCTQLSYVPKTKETKRSKRNGLFGRADFGRHPSEEDSDTCNIHKCGKPNPGVIYKSKKKR